MHGKFGPITTMKIIHIYYIYYIYVVVTYMWILFPSSQEGRPRGTWHSLSFWSMCGCLQCVQNMSTISLFHSMFRAWRQFVYRDRSYLDCLNHLCDPAIHQKSCLLVYLYAITPPLCSTLYKKHAEPPGSCGFLRQTLAHLIPAFSLCLWLWVFLHVLDVPVRFIPRAMLHALDSEYYSITPNEDTSSGRKMLRVLAYMQTLTRTCMYKCTCGYSVTCRKTCKGANRGEEGREGSGHSSHERGDIANYFSSSNSVGIFWWWRNI